MELDKADSPIVVRTPSVDSELLREPCVSNEPRFTDGGSELICRRSIADLPVELLTKIIRLAHESDGSSAFACVTVCKAWKAISLQVAYTDVVIRRTSTSDRFFDRLGKLHRSLCRRQSRTMSPLAEYVRSLVVNLPVDELDDDEMDHAVENTLTIIDTAWAVKKIELGQVQGHLARLDGFLPVAEVEPTEICLRGCLASDIASAVNAWSGCLTSLTVIKAFSCQANMPLLPDVGTSISELHLRSVDLSDADLVTLSHGVRATIKLLDLQFCEARVALNLVTELGDRIETLRLLPHVSPPMLNMPPYPNQRILELCEALRVLHLERVDLRNLPNEQGEKVSTFYHSISSRNLRSITLEDCHPISGVELHSAISDRILLPSLTSLDLRTVLDGTTGLDDLIAFTSLSDTCQARGVAYTIGIPISGKRFKTLTSSS